MAPRAARVTGKLPLLPCVCFGLGFVLLVINLVSTSLLVVDSDAFVGASRHAGLRPSASGSAVARAAQGADGNYKPTAADRGTPEYEEYMARKRRERKEDWDAYARGGYEKKVGEREGYGIWSALDPNAVKFGNAPAPSPENAPAPSPSTTPAPAPASSPVQAQAVAGPGPAQASGDEFGNPFQFLIDLFQPTTTTTTTTLPPSPFESFMNMFQR